MITSDEERKKKVNEAIVKWRQVVKDAESKGQTELDVLVIAVEDAVSMFTTSKVVEHKTDGQDLMVRLDVVDDHAVSFMHTLAEATEHVLRMVIHDGETVFIFKPIGSTEKKNTLESLLKRRVTDYYQ